MFKAAIFDFDGVIWNSTDMYLDIRKRYLKDNYKIKLTKKENMLHLATPTKEFIDYINQTYNQNIDYKEYLKVKYKMFKEYSKDLKVNLGIRDLLKNLRKNKIKIALSSSNERVVIIKNLKKLKLINNFDEIISFKDVKKHKPHPDPFLKAAKKLKVKPQECIAFEDAPLGITAINKAGMFSIAYITKFTNKRVFKDFNSKYITNNFKNLNYNKLVDIYEVKFRN